MQNKRIKKKIAKNNFCKSPVWHGAKIKTKDVRVLTYRGKFCDYGLVESDRPKLKDCPICGNFRRSGYYRCCPNCIWVLDWQDKVKGLAEQISDMMREYEARLSVCFYTPYIANIACEINAYCDPHEVTETHRNGERLTGEFKVEYKAKNFRTGKTLSLVDLRNATDPKKMLLDTVLELFRKAKESVESYIDRNGVMKTIAGVPIPVVGGLWK